jgi:hypothetical protein
MMAIRDFLASSNPVGEVNATPSITLRVITNRFVRRDKNSEVIPTGGFIAILVSIFSVTLLGVLVINMRLDQQAFVLQHLKAERNISMDAKDAVITQVDQKFSPIYLSAKAKSLGMIPATDLNYLNLSGKN